MGRKEIWSIEKSKNGFEKFYQEYGHYPTAVEIDEYDYLPTARQFQRKFGGLIKFRKLIGLSDVHLGKGKFRSDISSRVGKRGIDAEGKLEKILIQHFGEAFVHIERPINSQIRRVRYDFFIYAKNLQFAIDVFYSDTKRYARTNLDFKINTYKNTETILYLVMANPDISQIMLDEIVISKLNKPLPKHIKLVAWSQFLNLIKEIKPLEIKN